MSNCVSFYFHLNEIDTRMSMHRGCSTLGWPHNRIVMHTITRGEGVRKNSGAQSRSIDHTSLLHFRLRKIELWRKIFPSREEGKIGLFPPSLCLSLYLILFFFFDLFSIYLTISLLAIFILYHGLEEGRRYFWNGKFDGDIYNGKDLFPNWHNTWFIQSRYYTFSRRFVSLRYAKCVWL